ncbi:MAG: lactate utilization protein [Anaerolinea sp.]|nr:lactate utilization protein [Anaerolinea sp.]
MTNPTSSRERILSRLRGSPAPFPDAPNAPQPYLSVTNLPDTSPEALLTRFQHEWEALKGEITITPTPEAAIQTVIGLIGEAKQVMSWEPLPLPGLPEALHAQGVAVARPTVRGEDRSGPYAALDPISVGITGADGALATTGTLILNTQGGQGRLPSLLPPRHLVLLRRDRLFTHLEGWLAAEGRALLEASRSVALVSGPSKTGDIEMQIIYGVHGPKIVHVIVF